MSEPNYPCRTQEIHGTTYTIKMYRDGELRMSTSFESQEEADGYVKRMSERLPEITFEISSRPWTSNVCIECGREEY